MKRIEVIVNKKRERLNAARSRVPKVDLKARALDMPGTRNFKSAITRSDGIRLIAEIKKASPSRGPIRLDFEPADVARIYDSRANAISVLTEEDFFLGSLEYLGQVKAATSLPVLRKDFIFDEYQIYESRAAGADAILLIEGLLEVSQASDYLGLAQELGLEVLFEVHDAQGLQMALEAGASILGINNRNLDTFEVDLGNTMAVMDKVPKGMTLVSESGIKTREDVLRLQSAGVDAVLIGTAFMEAPDIGAKVDEMILNQTPQ